MYNTRVETGEQVMFGLLAMVGIGFILWWLSKGLKKLSAWLAKLSGTTADLISCSCKAKSNKEILWQNKIAKEELRSIKGESYVAFNHKVCVKIDPDIDQILKEIEFHA